MTTYRLGTKQKRMWNPRLDAFYGRVCFYCETPFLDEQHMIQGMTNPLLKEYDHANDKEYDNRIENILPCHKMCNSKKRYNQPMKDKALDQLRFNESHGIPEVAQIQELSVDEKENENGKDHNDEIYSNIEFMKITEEYLESNLQGDSIKIPLKSTIDSVAMLCFKKVGHGSPTSIRRAIDMLCSDEGNYYKYRDGGKQWISKQNPLLGK